MAIVLHIFFFGSNNSRMNLNQSQSLSNNPLKFFLFYTCMNNAIQTYCIVYIIFLFSRMWQRNPASSPLTIALPWMTSHPGATQDSMKTLPTSMVRQIVKKKKKKKNMLNTCCWQILYLYLYCLLYCWQIFLTYCTLYIAG